MDAILLTVTGISLALAAGMGALLGRLLRDERRRSDARVALLADLTGEAAADDTPRTRRDARSIRLDDYDLRPSPAADIHVQELFDDHHAPSAWPRRLAVIGSIAAVVVAVGFGWSHIRRSSAEPAPTARVQVRAGNAPLELLALRHTQDERKLTVAGLVQNPREGKLLSGVKITLFVFGPGGSFMASGQAALDFTSLAPGEESPFLVQVPVFGDIARYRIGFRGDDDRVLAHVDRRSADSLAQKQDP